MITVRMELDLAPVERQLSALEQSQLPFAASLGLNNLAKLAQSEIRAHYKTAFTLRRPEFIEREGAKIFSFATKRDLAVTLGVSERADFLEKFEMGGERPKRGQHIAIPSLVRRNKRDIVTRGMRPRPLIERLGKKKGAGGVFVVRDDSGRQPGVYQRTGRQGRGGLKLLYAFETSAQIPASLQFVAIAQRTAEQFWTQEFEKAMAQALRTAR